MWTKLEKNVQFNLKGVIILNYINADMTMLLIFYSEYHYIFLLKKVKRIEKKIKNRD